MNWHHLETIEQLENLKNEENTVLIFKHSTTCSISVAVKGRVERNWDKVSAIEPYYLDLKAFRSVSNAIADQLAIEHESPQAILLRDGKVLYHASHYDINVEDMMAHLN